MFRSNDCPVLTSNLLVYWILYSLLDIRRSEHLIEVGIYLYFGEHLEFIERNHQ